jgi:hypothetical protein
MLFWVSLFAGFAGQDVPAPPPSRPVTVVRVAAAGPAWGSEPLIRASDIDGAPTRSRYRLASTRYERVDMLTVARESHTPTCGLSGAPVCPSDGHLLWRGSFDD